MVDDGDQTTCGATCGMEEHERRLIRIDQKLPDWMQQIGVPARYITDHPLPQPVQRAIKAGQSLLFCGPTGTGKTTTMVSTLREIVRTHVLASRRAPERGVFRWVNYNEFFFTAQDVFRTEHDRILDYLQPIAACGYLFIDDLGKKRVTEFVRDALYYVIEYRDSHQKPTFITTNLDEAVFEREFDASIASRILGMCQTIQFSGKDFRLAKREQSLK